MGSSVDFDSYGEWNSYYSGQFGANYVLPTYRLKDTPDPAQPFTKEDQELLLGNLRQNVTALAAEHPETTFYLFFTPYSIGYWDFLNNTGKLGWQFEMERISIEELLQYPNIRLYSFSDDFEIICDLDNYKDYLHYGEWINSRILEQMKEEKHLLTKDCRLYRLFILPTITLPCTTDQKKKGPSCCLILTILSSCFCLWH